MMNAMESIGHRSLESGPGILQSKRYFLVCEGTPRTVKIRLVLINWENVNLIISRNTVHKGKNITPGTVVNDLIDEGSRIIILR